MSFLVVQQGKLWVWRYLGYKMGEIIVLLRQPPHLYNRQIFQLYCTLVHFEA